MPIRYKVGQWITHQGQKFRLLKFEGRDIGDGLEIWQAENDLQEVWRIYL